MSALSKHLNDFIDGCSDKELAYFLFKFDKLKSKHKIMIIEQLSYSNKFRLQ